MAVCKMRENREFCIRIDFLLCLAVCHDGVANLYEAVFFELFEVGPLLWRRHRAVCGEEVGLLDIVAEMQLDGFDERRVQLRILPQFV